MRSKYGSRLGVTGVLFLAAGVAIAANWTLSCNACGNSTEVRGWETSRFLYVFSGSPGVARRDTVTVNGGDGTSGKYLLTSKTATMRWTCILDCGPGDEVEAFLPVERDASHEPEANSGWGGGIWSHFVSWLWDSFVSAGIVDVGTPEPMPK